jgi:serine/threonine protein kinase
MPINLHRSLREDDFRIIRVIGKGSIGKVMLVQEKSSGQYYALKSIKKSDLPTDKQRKVARQERDVFAEKILQSDSPFLVKMYASFQTPTHLFYLLEYYAGGDFATLLAQKTRLDELCVRFYAAELVLALEALRDLKILFRDLKPENIVMTKDGHLVLVDLGLSKVLEPTQTNNVLTRTFCGTAEYLAPELLLNKPYSYAVDLWSFGTMLYEMLVGTPPYWAEKPQEMYQNIVNAGPIYLPSSLSFEVVHLIKELLRFDPHQRIGFHSIAQLKAHPFFVSVDWEALLEHRIDPPYRPMIYSSEDVTAFDESFTSLTPEITPVDRCDHAAAAVPQLFAGFTFNNNG